jgi:signal recognition particle subunit SRP54
MGDIVSLVKDFEEHVDEEKAEKDAMRMLKGQFTLDDFLEQLGTIKKMGSLGDLMQKMPGMSEMMPKGANVDDRELVRIEAMVHSMTPLERRKPELIDKQKSRRRRIALGSGRKEAEVESLLKRFAMMKQMFSMIGGNPGILGRLPGFKQIGQMAQISKAMGGAGGLNPEMAKMFSGYAPGSMGLPPMGAGGMRAQVRSNNQPSAKDKKDKRKREKAARKKNKKR